MDGNRFLLTGVCRLTVRVARQLVARGAHVVVVAAPEDELISALPAEAETIVVGGDPRERLKAGNVVDAETLLVLGEDDHENLRLVTAASEVAPDVPVVLRAFDTTLAEQLGAGRNVRRCYSASALAAPAFVAAVFDEEVRETLRLGAAEVPLCVLTINDDSPLRGRTYSDMKRDWGCAAIAHAPRGKEWAAARGDEGTIEAGDEVLVGGLLPDVLRLACRNSPVLRGRHHHWRPALPRRRSTTPGTPNLVPAATVALIILLALTAGVFAVALDTDPADAVYRALTNAFGDVGLADEDSWLKIFGVAVMVAAAVLIGVLLTHLTAMFTANRIEERAGRHARRMRDHVIIAGLGTLGFRIERLLDELGVPTVVIERSPDNRFREAAAARSPVLAGDVRLAENLDRASVAHARCLLACTNDELTNVAACVQARRMNPKLRTVARIFDDDLAERLGGFGIDVVVSQSGAAAGAFVGAATDERAARHLAIDGLELTAFRHTLGHDLSAEELARWREQAVRVAAVQPPGGSPQPPNVAMDGVPAGSEVVVAGPETTVQETVLELD
jgi:Trk K+ transport system NAD-binding subunit